MTTTTTTVQLLRSSTDQAVLGRLISVFRLPHFLFCRHGQGIHDRLSTAAYRSTVHLSLAPATLKRLSIPFSRTRVPWD